MRGGDGGAGTPIPRGAPVPKPPRKTAPTRNGVIRRHLPGFQGRKGPRARSRVRRGVRVSPGAPGRVPGGRQPGPSDWPVFAR